MSLEFNEAYYSNLQQKMMVFVTVNRSSVIVRKIDYSLSTGCLA